MSISGSDVQGKPWGGRFSVGMDKLLEKFSASVQYDRRLFEQDIRGSIAYAEALHKAGTLSTDEKKDIQSALRSIRSEIIQGKFVWKEELEDVHMNIEVRLVELVGAAGGKIHAGRSRNDQVATDLRLFTRDIIDEILRLLRQLCLDIIEVADREIKTIIPMYTHLQPAQPISFGHHMMAWYEMGKRDFKRWQAMRRRVNTLPLGSAAGAGSNYDIDRDFLASLLEFEAVSDNSLDAVADRDFVIEFCSNGALVMMHLSRFCEEIVLWMSQPYSFIQLPDELCTGSSIMPQKKNPDAAELIRGKCGRVYGHLMAMLTLMKSQPLGYNRDNQEDKEALFDCSDTLQGCLQMMSAIIQRMKVDRKATRQAASYGYLTATDVADGLAKKGIPFRQAHAIVGKLVQKAAVSGRNLEDFSVAQLQDVHPALDEDLQLKMGVEQSVGQKSTHGGTSCSQVRKQVRIARDYLGDVGRDVS